MSNNGKFQLQRRTALLVFEGDYEGLEIRTRLDVPLGLFLEIQTMVEANQTKEILEKFGNEILISWNLQEEGKDIPSNADGILQMPIILSTLLIEKWTEVVAKPEDPLSEQSNSSDILVDIPMS
jgi:hypothetical protein